LLRVLDGIPGGPHEVVLVDDGSTDSSRRLMEEAAQRDHRLKVIVLSRNFGHQAALGAALDHATGDAVVLMDADLQDQPEAIPEFLRHHQAGADVVFARRVSREEGWFMRAAYKVAYRVISALSETKLPLDTGDFALLGAPVVGLALASTAVGQPNAKPGDPQNGRKIFKKFCAECHNFVANGTRATAKGGVRGSDLDVPDENRLLLERPAMRAREHPTGFVGLHRRAAIGAIRRRFH
jgi:glycosyltransferase involved in cell wall biosynthesis